MSEEPQSKSTQITLKIPTDFLKDFDQTCAQLGYPRNEAVREAMRRFLDFGYQKLNERHPERAIGLVQGMISSVFGGVMEEAKRLESTPPTRVLEDKSKAPRETKAQKSQAARQGQD